MMFSKIKIIEFIINVDDNNYYNENIFWMKATLL